MSTNENTPISGQFWDWMQSYWHSNRDFPPAHPDWRKKADLVNGKVPAGQLPSYVDDVLEFSSYADLPQSGEKGKIYITTKDNKQFRWGGSAYIEINSSEKVGSKIINGSYNANDLSTNSITYGYSVANAPSTVGAHSFSILNLDTTNPDYKMQLGFDGDTNEMFSRIKSNGHWTDWSKYAISSQLENVVTTNTSQEITATKIFLSSGNGFYNNTLQVYSDGSVNASMSFYKEDFGVAQLSYDGDGFHTVDAYGSDHIPFTAKAFKKSNSDDSYLLLGGGGHKSLSEFMTTNTSQDVTGTKSYVNSSGNSSLYDNKLHVKGTNGSKAGISFWSDDVGQLTYFNTGFHFKNQFDTAYQFAKASAFIKDGSDNSYVLLGGGGHKPVSEFVSSADFSVVHKFDQSGGINNGSGTRINKSWFDYHWAETGKAGSVINFSGLSGAYSTELFADYYYGNSIGFRTHNGDTNSWNPVRWLWHSGNFDPNNFIPKKANQISYGHKNPNENIGSTEIGVVSYNNNDNYSFGDYIHFGGGENNGSGYRNLVMFYKHGGGMRQYFAAPEQTTPYTDYVDYWHTGNLANPLQADDHPFASDFNDLRAKKIRLEQGWNAKNQPAGTVAGHISTFNYDINLGAQQFHSYYTNDLYLRIRNDNTYSSWQKVWHSGNFSDTDIQNWKNLSNNIFITNDQDPTNLYIKENKFGWLNGAITGAGNIKSWTGNYIAISGVPGVGHTSQLLISKNQLLFRCNYGNEDTAFNEVFHTGNFNQADYVKLNSIQIIDAHKTFNGGLASTRYEWSGSTTTPAGKVSKESAFFNLGSDYGYGISTNIGGGLDIMANQGGQPIRFWAGNGNNNPFNVVNFYKEIARYYTNISIDEGKEIRLKGPDDIAHYIKHFSDDTDGFGVSTGFAVKFYNDSSKNLLLVDGSGTYVNGNRVWDLGNFNPEWKAERENNAVGIGFEGGNIENPYMKHNAGAAYLATKNWITSSFIPKTHPTASIGQSQINGWNNSISQSSASEEVILEDDTLKIQPDELSLEGSGSYDIGSRKKLVHVLLREGKEVNIRELIRRQTMVVFNFSKDPVSLNIEGLKPYALSSGMQVTLYISDEGEVLLYNETGFKKLQ